MSFIRPKTLLCTQCVQLERLGNHTPCPHAAAGQHRVNLGETADDHVPADLVNSTSPGVARSYSSRSIGHKSRSLLGLV